MSSLYAHGSKKKGSKKRRKKKRETVNLHTSHHSHHGVGGYSKVINGLRAAASAWRLCMPTSALTVHMLKMYCKEGMSVVLSFTTLFITRKIEKLSPILSTDTTVNRRILL